MEMKGGEEMHGDRPASGRPETGATGLEAQRLSALLQELMTDDRDYEGTVL